MVGKRVLALIALGGLMVPAHGKSLEGKCYVWWKNADAQPVMRTSEKCLITSRPNGSFDVRPKGLPHPLVIVEIEDGNAYARFGYPAWEAQMGSVTRDGACWSNDWFKVCAWR
jgi:hypothetical protein